MEYDAFISHNSADKAIVREICAKLKSRGVNVFFDEAAIPGGASWIPSLLSALENSKSCVLFYGPNGIGAWQEKEEELSLNKERESSQKERKFKIIPVRLPGAPTLDQLPSYGYLRLFQLVEFSSINDALALTRLEEAIKGVEPHPTDLKSPYIGMKPFDENGSDRFFGRQRILAELVHMVTTPSIPRFTVVIGASGSGKSSLLQAGLVPRLKAGGFGKETKLLLMRPGRDAMTVLYIKTGELLAKKLPGSLLNKSWPKEGLHMAGVALCGNEHGAPRLVVIVDQAEELFTYQPSTVAVEERQNYLNGTLRPFLENLSYAAMEPTGPVVVVLALRSDFITYFEREPALKGLIDQRPLRCLVPPLSEEEVRAAIEQPAVLCGFSVDPQLVQAIVDDYLLDPQGALPFLQEALFRVWERRQGQNLDLRAYQQLGKEGGFRGALSSHAEKVMELLRAEDKNNGTTRSALAQSLFLHLVQPENLGAPATKRRVPLESGSFPGGIAGIELARNLADPDGTLKSRLLVTDEAPTAMDGHESGTVEIAHESLVRSWGQLREWLLDKDVRAFLELRSQIELAMSKWCPGMKHSAVLSRQVLNDAAKLLVESRFTSAKQGQSTSVLQHSGSPRNLLGDQTWKFVKAALTHRSFLRLLSVMASLSLLLLLLFLGGSSLRQRFAVVDSDIARGNIQMLSGDIRGTVQEFSRQLRESSFLRPQPATRLRLSLALQQSLDPAAPPLCLDEPVEQLALSPNGTEGIALMTNKLVLWNLTNAKLVKSWTASALFSNATAYLNHAEIGAGGRLLAIAASDGLRIVNIPEERVHVLAPSNRVEYVAFNRDSSTIISAGENGTELWTVSTNGDAVSQAITLPSRARRRLLYCSFSQDGEYAISAGDDGFGVWHIGKGATTIRHFEVRKLEVACACLNSNGHYIIAAGDFGMRVYEMSDHNPVASLDYSVVYSNSNGGNALWSAFDPTGGHATCVYGDGQVAFWPDPRPNFLKTPGAHRKRANFVCYSPAGDGIVTAADDGLAVLWDARTCQPIGTMPHGGKVKWAACGSDKQVVTASDDQTIRIWNARHIKVLPHLAEIATNAWSKSGTILATVAAEPQNAGNRDAWRWRLTLWDTETGQVLYTNVNTTEQSPHITACYFDDTASAVTVQFEDGAKWEPGDTRIAELDRTNISNLIPAEYYVATIVGELKVVNVTHPRSRELLCCLPHTDNIEYYQFSPTHRYLLVVCHNGTARLWDLADLSPSELQQQAKQIVPEIHSPK